MVVKSGHFNFLVGLLPILLLLAPTLIRSNWQGACMEYLKWHSLGRWWFLWIEHEETFFESSFKNTSAIMIRLTSGFGLFSGGTATEIANAILNENQKLNCQEENRQNAKLDIYELTNSILRLVHVQNHQSEAISKGALICLRNLCTVSNEGFYFVSTNLDNKISS